MTDHLAFDRRRREARVTCSEIADFLGCNVRWLIGVIELGDEPITPSIVNALDKLIARKGRV